MPVLTGTPSLVIASRVQVHHSCSVDLTWQRAVHSCQRCPRAALVRTAVTMPALTQSHVERTHSRFCPAGVHMGSCVPASEVFTACPKHHTVTKSPIHVTATGGGGGGEKTNQSSTLGMTTSEFAPSVWGAPPNLPLPSASPHHPVHAAHLARSSYPPATAASSTPFSTTTQSTHRVNLAGPDASTKDADSKETAKLPLMNGFVVSEVKPSAGSNDPPKSTPMSVPTVTIVREPQALCSSSAKVDDSKNQKEPTNLHTIVLSSSSSAKPTDASTKQSETVLDVRTSDSSVGKRPKDDDTAPVSSKIRTVGDPPHALIDDGSSSARAAIKTVTVNENELLSNKTVSKPNERAISKQPVLSSVSDSDPVHNRVLSSATPAREAREPGRHQVTSSATAGGVGDVNLALMKPNNSRLEPHHPASGPDLPIPPVSKTPGVPCSPPKPLVPAFHFPLGSTRMTSEEVTFELDRAKRELTHVVEPMLASNDAKKNPGDLMIPYNSFGQVAKALNCPFYWKYPIYSASGGDADRRAVTLSSVLKMWQRVLTNCPDESARFVYMLTGGRSAYLDPASFDPLIQDILESHPGLEFLREAEDFHSRYVSTVVSRIFFNVNASWSGRISLSELRRSNFLSVLASLEDQRDINLITQYFSYEHFYVIYCKFWELDDDHDLIISRSDLARHNNYAISERMIDRIFSGTVTKGTDFKEGLMRYPDFVWFLLAEEDKRHPRSIEYWFRCMDLDGDGLLSMYELEYFYSEQLARMEEMGIEPISFEDCLCQCLDMVKPVLGNKIRLSDMKRCRLCHIFFDTFFNLPKYLQHEQRDPFANLRDIEEGLNELSDWDRYAAEAYEMLITIENGNREDVVDEDDVEEDIDDAVLATPITTTTAASDRVGTGE